MTGRWMKAPAVMAALGAGGLAMATEPRPGAVVAVPYMLACGATESLVAALAANGESMVARGMSTGGPLTQFWINPSSREWSVVFVDPATGRSCLVAAGKDFKAERPTPDLPEPPKDRAT